MSAPRLLADAGPLVALYSERDQHHERCLEELGRWKQPLLACWPVVAEAMWLLRKDHRAVDFLFKAFADNIVNLLPLGAEALPWLNEFMRRYRSLGAQLADAAVVYLAQREGITTVFTLDHRDFRVYRYGKNQSLTIVPSLDR